MKKPKKPAAKATKQPAPDLPAPKMPEPKNYEVWEHDCPKGARVFTAAEPTAAALDYCAAVYPGHGNRCASVRMSEAQVGGAVRVFLHDSKPVPYVFVKEVAQ